MTIFLSAIPAYGRDYKSKKEVMEAWKVGKDFLTVGYGETGYMNIDDKSGTRIAR